MDMADATNAPREVIIDGLRYMVSALTRNEWGMLQAWLKDHAKDPITRAYAELAAVRKKGIEIDDRDRDSTLARAREESLSWPPIVASVRWFELMNSTDGGPTKFFEVVLRKHQPSLSDEQIAVLIAAVDGETTEIIVWRAIGVEPPPKAKRPDAPIKRKRSRATGAKRPTKSTTT